MSSAAPDITEDVIDVEELEEVPEKGHRHLDDIWQYYKKIRLPNDKADTLHRNYDARCKYCGETVVGKPQMMRKHTSKCTSTSHTGQLHALSEQAKQADSHASNQSRNQSAASEANGQPKTCQLDKYVDRIKITPHQMKRWCMLLAIAFVMNGWSFSSVESPYFKDFVQHVRRC